MRCAVSKCKQSNSRKSSDGKSVAFYSFPKDPTQRNLWITFCNRTNTIKKQNERICALHFKTEDFERNLKFELGCSKRSTAKLKPGAVPTIQPIAIRKEIEAHRDNENPSRTIDIKVQSTPKLKSEAVPIMDVSAIKSEIQTYSDEKNAPVTIEIKETSTPKLKQDAIPVIDVSGIKTEIETHTSDAENPIITTNIKEENLQFYIKSLEMKINELDKENFLLKTLQNRSSMEIKNLNFKVQNLTIAKENLEKALRRIFSEGQIKKLKSGDKRQNFSEADIAQSMILYSASAKAYRLLKKRHFPLPSVRTLQRWSQKLNRQKLC